MELSRMVGICSLSRYTLLIRLNLTLILDEDFKSFVASLSTPDAPVETVAEPTSPPKSTPLLEALIQSKERTSGGNKRSGPGGVLTILSRTQQLKEDEQYFSRASPIVPTEERAKPSAGGSEKEGGNTKGRWKRSAAPVQPGTPSTLNPQKQRQVSGGKPGGSAAKQPTPAAAPSGDQQRAATPTKNRTPLPAASPDESRKKKRAKERAKKEKEKGRDKDQGRDEDDEPTAAGSSGQQQAQTGGSREKPARKTAPGQPIPAASSSSQAQKGRTASVGAASESGPAQTQEGEPKSPTIERGRGRGRGGGGGGRGRGRGGAKEVDKMDVPVKIIQRPTLSVTQPPAPAEPAPVSTPATATATALPPQLRVLGLREVLEVLLLTEISVVVVVVESQEVGVVGSVVGEAGGEVEITGGEVGEDVESSISLFTTLRSSRRETIWVVFYYASPSDFNPFKWQHMHRKDLVRMEDTFLSTFVVFRRTGTQGRRASVDRQYMRHANR
jgi:hypothetical protein